MCGFVREVLNAIKEPFLCTIDGASQEYENGTAAIERLAENIKVSHKIERIGSNDGKLCVTIVDQQHEIDERNKVWMAEQKAKTGTEPSFF